MIWNPLPAVIAALSYLSYGGWQSLSPQASANGDRWNCRPFLPNLFVETPPSPGLPVIRGATKALNDYFTSKFAQGGIDSLSAAVVTSNTVLYEKNFGVLRANETNSPPTTSHASYRIASISKLFTVLEGFILEQRGIISWDDPVDKYLEDFRYRLDGLDPHGPQPTPEEAPITLLQLATHMSGLGRDWPPGSAANWPYEVSGGGPPPDNGRPFPTYEALFDDLPKHHLVSYPWTYPSYSNTGVGILGLALAAASSAADGNYSRISHADLLQRDIFGPLGLNGSHFLATDQNKDSIVISSVMPEVVDDDFLNPMNPSGGQFSSLSDFIMLAQTLLNPRHPKSPLTQYSLNRWFKPVHAFEEDDWTEMGFLWEVIKARDSSGRLRRIYWKLGNLPGFNTVIAVHPGSSYSVIVLMAGSYPDAAELAYDAFEIMQPGIDRALSDLVKELYSGQWVVVQPGQNTTEGSSATITVHKGTLYIDEFILLGVDALEKMDAKGRVALRPTRRDEFRLDIGLPLYNGKRHTACFPYWVGQDSWGLRDNAPINAIYFTSSGEGRRLHIPSLSMVMERMR
ncbi:beta-lactamase/transpeptidase-like protein [Dichomitus squalens]|uniref:Beta-lactamase/transpeptidase-like protein n=1 Tax=Dichomitus squalens TaxID=114155 RepID=A0A4Q9PSY3_9APHY|nr:beta-lactamase/transpeptidase-like protein [Dichomitus squalens]